MTSYITSTPYINTDSTLVQSVTILAVTYALKVIKIEAYMGNGGGQPLDIAQYAGAGVSGGTALTVSPLRAGAPTASATAKKTATITGTKIGLNVQAVAGSAPFTYQFVSDLIIAPGSALRVQNTILGSGALNFFSMDIQFEELHLARST